MAYMTVDIDLRDIDTDELIEELEGRYLDERRQQYLIDMIKDNDGGRLAFLMKIKDSYTLVELQEMLKEKFSPSPVPKEQLSIDFNTNQSP